MGHSASQDKRRFRVSANLIMSNLDRITHVRDVGNQRPRDALDLLAPITVSENWCKRRHLGLTLGSIKSLVLAGPWSAPERPISAEPQNRLSIGSRTIRSASPEAA
jgi:hypothetical protein